MKKFTWLALLILTTLCGCARAKPIIGPDGKEAYSINCGGIQNSMADCIAKAGEICGARGYEMLGGNEESPSAILGTGTINYVPIKTFHRNLFIKCK